MKILASPLFQRRVKKLPKQDHLTVDEQIRLILLDPTIGDEKKQDLKGIFVHKFRLNNQEVLLSYKVTEDFIYLLTIGSHENYYRDLKKYI